MKYRFLHSAHSALKLTPRSVQMSSTAATFGIGLKLQQIMHFECDFAQLADSAPFSTRNWTVQRQEPGGPAAPPPEEVGPNRWNK